MAAERAIMAFETIAFLEGLADQLDGWAEQSRSGGWSTHQVDANRKAADNCRRQAARLKRVYLIDAVT